MVRPRPEAPGAFVCSWSGSFHDDQLSSHVFVTLAAENVAEEHERAGFHRPQSQPCGHPRNDVSACVKIWQLEAHGDIERREFEGDGLTSLERDHARIEFKSLG